MLQHHPSSSWPLACGIHPSACVLDWAVKKVASNSSMVRKAALQRGGERVSEAIGGDAERRVHIARRIFSDGAAARAAEDDADAGLVVGMAEQIIHGGEIKVHLAGEFGLERTDLE